jgi:uncharacterized DUF497 family protein
MENKPLIYMFGMDFEFDPVKSESNRKKHGVDFIEAQELWLDSRHLEIQAKQVLDEPRWALIGMLGDAVWTGIFVMRANRIRIISVRRAREEEKELYYG